MEAMGLIAIIVNCYLIGQCGQLQRLFPWLSPEMTIVSIVLLEVGSVLALQMQVCPRLSSLVWGHQTCTTVFYLFVVFFLVDVT